MRRFFSSRKESVATVSSEGSSSTGSGSVLQTPDDDEPPKRSWKTWLGSKRTPSQKHLRPPPVPSWPSDDDVSDTDESSVSPAIRPPPPSPSHVRQYVLNSLVPSQPVPPFVQTDLAVVYPRSVNRPQALPAQSSFRVHFLKTRLLGSLQSANLSAADILPLSQKQSPQPLPEPPSSFPNLSRPPASLKLHTASPGIRRWITRPCFEERYLVYSSAEPGILHCRPVSASFAIAALEYPEHLDVMADPDFDTSPRQSPPPSSKNVGDIQSHANDLSVPASQARNSYTAVPSPLRNQHSPPPSASMPPPAATSVKRVVRFAEDDSDDGIPLHLVRQKKKREQKAHFLKQERVRRVKEEEGERRRQEQEARERERSRLVAEKERKEKEQRQHAEAVQAARMRRETQRAGGVPSVNNRNGLLVPSSPSTPSERNKPLDTRAYSSSKVPQVISTIPNPRRDTSESSLHPISHHSPSDSSPASSRPPSVLAHSPVSLNGQTLHSRPTSTYSSSSEDIRQQSGSRRNSAMAPPMVPPMPVMAMGMNGYGLPSPMIMAYPTWSGSNPNIHYIAPFPNAVQDMPLLPPTAPFMKNASYEKRSSRNSSPASSAPSSRRGSFSSSQEHLPPMSRHSSVPRPERQSSTPPSTVRKASEPTMRPTHLRQGSAESKHTLHTQHSSATSRTLDHRPPLPSNSRSQPVVSRGRPQYPAKSATQPPPPPMPTISTSPPGSFLHASMNPWTALPTQSGLVPVMMPVSPYTHNLGSTGSLRGSMYMGGGQANGSGYLQGPTVGGGSGSRSGSMASRGNGSRRQTIIS